MDVEAKDLARALARARHAAMRAVGVPRFERVFCTVREEKLELLSSDNFRLAIQRLEYKGDPQDFSIPILELPLVLVFLRGIANFGDVSITVGATMIKLQSPGGTFLTIHGSDAKPPDWTPVEQMIPADAKRVLVNANFLREALAGFHGERVYITVGGAAVPIHIERAYAGLPDHEFVMPLREAKQDGAEAPAPPPEDTGTDPRDA